MCGICGIINPHGDPVSPVNLRRMTDTLAHRGPDGEGMYVYQNVGLGHRRLAIIDLSPAGHQPMGSSDGRFMLCYNGEIYNFQELRLELESLGYHFRSRTDSEVVLHALCEWGTQAFYRFNGMFALAFWDAKTGELILARDRYGIKPLYYSTKDGRLLFGSESRAILAHSKFRADLDRGALLEYFTFQNFFTDKTLFKDINLLPAGCYMKIPADNPEDRKLYRYWDFDFSDPEQTRDEWEYIEELDRLFRQAVHRQTVSDVEIGSYLSGGIDSGSITAIAAGQLPYIKTFTCGFDLHTASGLELGFDERERSEYLSYLFKTEHYEMVIKSGDMERILPTLAGVLEEPRVGQSYPNYYMAQLVSKFVKVVLSGSGGDEMFGGYPWRYYRAVSNDGFEDYIDKYYLYWQRLINNKNLQRIFKPIWNDVGHVWTRDIFRDVFLIQQDVGTRPQDYVNRSLYFEAKTFLHGLLIIEDKLSMAHSLETRVPFLDNDLVDFAMKVPVSLKLGNLEDVVRINENEPAKVIKYYNKTRDGKLILRRAMQRYVPEVISNGIKQGFSAPDASWFKGDSILYVYDMLFNSNARIYEYFDRKVVQELVNEHLEGKINRRLFIWSLLNFEWWLRKFLP